MQIVYNRTTQFIIDVNENITEEEILEMSEQDLIDTMTDITYQCEDKLGSIFNQHGKVEFELLNDDEESIRHFESYKES